MNTHKVSFLLLAIFALSCASAHAAQLASAKVVSVIGTVTKYAADGSATPLSNGDVLTEGFSISATALSQAKLVFSNGSEVTVEENTSINLAKLSQENFGGGSTYEQLEADPSRSQTLLELNYGNVDFHVKKLKAGSSFDIETPLGTAAIRGTQGTVSLLYNAERGEYLLVIENAGGKIDIISRFSGSIDYSDAKIGEKGYDGGLTEDASEAIPSTYTVIIRLHESDPYFNDLIDIIENYVPTAPRPVITPPGTGVEIDSDDDPEEDDDDFGVIIVSPEMEFPEGQ